MESYQLPPAEELSRDFIRGLAYGMTETARTFENHAGELWSSDQVAEILRHGAESASTILEEFIS